MKKKGCGKLKKGPQEDIHIESREPVNVILFAKRIFADAVKILRWGSNSDEVFYKRKVEWDLRDGEKRWTHRESDVKTEIDIGVAWSQVKEYQGKAVNTRS